jgi:cation transport regulator ChaB
MTDGYLIELPIGTDKRGLHLAPPHGELIYQRRKTAIAKARPFDISGPWILISGGMAYGTLDVGLPESVTAEEFDKRFNEHRVTCSERKRWWPGVNPLWLSKIRYFEAFEKPYPINVISGMQTVVEEVEFKSEPPPCLGEHCEEARAVLQEVTLARGDKQRKDREPPEQRVSLAQVIDEPITVEDSSGAVTVVTPQEAHAVPDVLCLLTTRIHKAFTVAADDLCALGYMTQEQRIALSGAIGDALDRFNEVLEANGLAQRLAGMPVDPTHAQMIAEKMQDLEDAQSARDGLEAHARGETMPWDDVKEQLAGSKEDESMPYDPENPPEKLHGLPDKAQRTFVHTFNSCMEKYEDEGRCHQIAYGAVENAGYYRTEDGT